MVSSATVTSLAEQAELAILLKGNRAATPRDRLRMVLLLAASAEPGDFGRQMLGGSVLGAGAESRVPVQSASAEAEVRAVGVPAADVTASMSVSECSDAMGDRAAHAHTVLQLRSTSREEPVLRGYGERRNGESLTPKPARSVWAGYQFPFHGPSQLLSSAARGRLSTTGCSQHGGIEGMRWTVWEPPASRDAVRSLLAADIPAAESERRALLARGVVEIFEVDRTRVGEGANFKTSFSPARAIGL